MEYRPEIDGMRAVAVVPVVLFHAGVPGFSGGYLGVDVFFVISGFLITTIVSDQISAGTFSLAHFYERRARRLMPALFAVLAFVLVAGLVVSLPPLLEELGGSLVAVCLYVSNLLFWQRTDYFAIDAELNPLLHTWSLAVEEQFYLLFPTLLLLGTRWMGRHVRWGVLAVGAASLAVAQWASIEAPEYGFYMPHTRAWELMAGAALALFPELKRVVVQRPRLAEGGAALGLLATVASMAWFDVSTPTPSLYTVVPVLGTTLVLLCAGPATWTGRLLSLGPFVHVGLISYSLYLWHQPLLAFARQYSVGVVAPSTMALLVGVGFVLGELSWRYVEAPFRRSGGLTRRTIFGGTALASTAFIAVGLGLHASEGRVLVSPEVEAALAAATPANPRRSECHWKHGDPEDLAPCTLGDDRLPPSVVLLGDSHADVLAPALSERLERSGASGTQLTYSGCPPVRGVVRRDRGRRHTCDDFNEYAFEAVSEPAVETVIVAARWGRAWHAVPFDSGEGCVEPGRPQRLEVVEHPLGPESAGFGGRMRASLQALADTGKNIVLVHPFPEIGCHVPWSLAKLRSRGGGTLTVSLDAYEARTRGPRAVLDSITGDNVYRVYPTGLFCTDGRCASELDGAILYSDEDHLSRAGADRVFEAIDDLGLLP